MNNRNWNKFRFESAFLLNFIAFLDFQSTITDYSLQQNIQCGRGLSAIAISCWNYAIDKSIGKNWNDLFCTAVRRCNAMLYHIFSTNIIVKRSQPRVFTWHCRFMFMFSSISMTHKCILTTVFSRAFEFQHCSWLCTFHWSKRICCILWLSESTPEHVYIFMCNNYSRPFDVKMLKMFSSFILMALFCRSALLHKMRLFILSCNIIFRNFVKLSIFAQEKRQQFNIICLSYHQQHSFLR